jgi:hypothetical protein
VNDVTLTPQTIAVVGTLLTALVVTIGALSSAVLVLYRQVLKERDRLLEERDARLVDLWRDLEEKEIRITTLEAGNERLQRLATDATEGWKALVIAERARPL